MNKLLINCLVWVLTSLMVLSLPLTAQHTPPLEVKRDQLMEKRFMTSLAALREADDKKTLSMLKAMAQEYIEAMEKLKPAYEKWYKGLSVEEKMALLESTYHKKWILLMQEIQFDEQILARFMAKPELKRAYEHIQFRCDRAAQLEINNNQ